MENNGEMEKEDEEETTKDSKEVTTEEKKKGNFPLSERSKRILKYKAVIFQRRLRFPVSKRFTGRSKVALQKTRLNGKFIKSNKDV